MRNFLTTALLLTAAIYATEGLALAGDTELMSVNLPYAAKFGNSTLPAGAYVISDMTDDGGDCVLRIKSMAGVSVIALVQRVDNPGRSDSGQTHVTLRRESDEYQLTRIWLGGRGYSYEVLSGNAKQ